jgi:hypothetical protein
MDMVFLPKVVFLQEFIPTIDWRAAGRFEGDQMPPKRSKRILSFTSSMWKEEKPDF